MMNEDQINRLILAISKIAHGPTSGPTGLELVSMSLSNDEVGSGTSVSGALRAIAEAIGDLAAAIRELHNETE